MLEILTALGWTKDHAAKLLGVHRSTIARWCVDGKGGAYRAAMRKLIGAEVALREIFVKDAARRSNRKVRYPDCAESWVLFDDDGKGYATVWVNLWPE